MKKIMNSAAKDKLERVKKAKEVFYDPSRAKEPQIDRVIAALKVITDDCDIQMEGRQHFKKCRSERMNIDDALTSTLELAIAQEKKAINKPSSTPEDSEKDLTKTLTAEIEKDLTDADKVDVKAIAEVEKAEAKTKNDNKFFVWAKRNKTATFWVVIAVILIIVLSVFSWKYDNKKDTAKPTETGIGTDADADTDADTDNTTNVKTEATTQNEQRAIDVLTANGWESGKYTLKIDKLMDKSIAGEGSYSKDAIYTPEDEVAFLKTETAAAKGTIEYIKEATGNTEDQITNSENWVSVQALTSFTYRGNTGFSNKGIFEAGQLQGDYGDIFLLYLPVVNAGETQEHADEDVVSSRGACGNVQGFMPVPSTPSTPPTSLQSKNPSLDPAAKGNAPTGGGTNVDSGPGTYIAPENMEQPAATTYVAPAAPAPTTTVPSGSTPDTTPAPAAESQAPTPDAPATGEVAVPGF